MGVRNNIPEGTVFVSKTGVEVVVVEYVSCMHVTVKRTIDGVMFNCTAANLRKGVASGRVSAVSEDSKSLPEGARWIPGMEGAYAATPEGSIVSVKGLYPRYLKSPVRSGQGPNRDKSTYKAVCLTLGGMNKSFYVHRLVASAFIPNDECLPQVNHKDGDKLNNSVGNLEWCSASSNVQHAHDTGLITTSRSSHISNGKYDARFKEAELSGYATPATIRIIEHATDEELISRGVDPCRMRAVSPKILQRKASTEEIKRMYDSGHSMTHIANATGYSLASISLKIRGKRN